MSVARTRITPYALAAAALVVVMGTSTAKAAPVSDGDQQIAKSGVFQAADFPGGLASDAVQEVEGHRGLPRAQEGHSRRP